MHHLYFDVPNLWVLWDTQLLLPYRLLQWSLGQRWGETENGRERQSVKLREELIFFLIAYFAMPGISPPTALDFNALIKELRNQRKQEQRGFIEFSKITSHKLYNLLQSDPWNDKKVNDIITVLISPLWCYTVIWFQVLGYRQSSIKRICHISSEGSDEYNMYVLMITKILSGFLIGTETQFSLWMRSCSSAPQELDVLLGPSTSSTLEQRYSVIVYGNHENIDTTELFKLIQVRSLFTDIYLFSICVI